MAPDGMPEPIRRSMAILATHRALFGHRGRRQGTRVMSPEDIARVVELFEAKRARWALVGAHAIGLLTEPRATTDFDFVVDAAKLDGVLAALTEEFGELSANDIGAAIQLRAIDVDLIRSSQHLLFQRALDLVRTVGVWKVPRTEVLMVLKFLAAVSPARDRRKRRQDVTDLSYLHEVAADQLDRALMTELASHVYPGAEREFSELLDKIERGDPISI
ncbi:MAG TPA: hypothetical protein VFK02_02625 [Kofleriaceae bacterium]|nr:hypothetical protein [Kofleriaceae bacterium]